MEILGKLMGGVARLKLMRLFLFNPDQGFTPAEVAARGLITPAVARREISFLGKLKFIRPGMCEREAKTSKGGITLIKKKRMLGWYFNRDFAYAESLRDLLIDSRFLEHEKVVRRFRHGGRIKLLIVSGVFIKDKNSRLDLLIVGDGLRRSKIEQSLKTMESEIGKELRYAVLDTKEFTYRLDMCDKFVRDVLDYPHERLIEKIKLE
ncbi:MAG: hypothetical protein Q8Q36_01975 [bacterium]|nr:hypothetical protein [bacterium]